MSTQLTLDFPINTTIPIIYKEESQNRVDKNRRLSMVAIKPNKNICVFCENNPIKIKKWRLCDSCYQKLFRRSMLKKLKGHFYETTYELIKHMIAKKFTKEEIIKFCQLTNYKLQQSDSIFLNAILNEHTENNEIKIKKPELKSSQSNKQETKQSKDTENCSVGKSGTTPFKQMDLLKLIADQLQVIYYIYRKYHESSWFPVDPILLIDCTAGTLNPKEPTSPSTFLHIIKKYPDLPTKLYLIENNPNTFNELSLNYDKYYRKEVDKNPNLTVVLRNADFQHVLNNEITTSRKYQYGLLYFDPNGCKLDEYVSITAFLSVNTYMNTILNINTSSLFRNRGAGIHNAKGFDVYKDFYLLTILDHINRENIWVRDNIEINNTANHSKYEFVMVFGTNMKKYKPLNYNFVPLYSEKGQDLLFQYNYTKEEKKNLLQRNKTRLSQAQKEMNEDGIYSN